jgi:hypothetical protein
MKKNFAAQPEGGGMIDMLTGLDLTTDIRPSDFDNNRVFQKNKIFNNCQNCNSMKNASGSTFKNADDGYDYGYNDSSSSGGGFLAGLTLSDLLKTGSTIYGNVQQRDIAQQTAQITANQAEIERARAAQARSDAEAARANSAGVVGKIKAYALPIAITGVVAIAGIAAYFFFKKKKIS